MVPEPSDVVAIVPEPAGRRALSLKDAAELAGVHERTVRRAIHSGALPGFRNRSARRLVVFQDDLERWAFEPVRPTGTHAPERRPARHRPAARGSVARLRAIEAEAKP